MPGESNIEWTDATWNPVTGCSKVSQGCKNCYAERWFPRANKRRKFTDVRIHPDRLDWPLRWRGSPQAKAEGRPSRIFVNSMSDLFHEDVPDEFILAVVRMMVSSRHVFQILTKRPQRMLKEFSKIPTLDKFENIWLGVSVEDQRTADERIPLLLQTTAAVRFVSYEPALGPMTLNYCEVGMSGRSENRLSCRIDWVIAGGESGPHARPSHPDWFRIVRNQCKAAGVPFFFKQWGEWLPAGQDGALIEGQPQEINSSDKPVRVGKKKAGRLLDGREWKEFPASREL